MGLVKGPYRVTRRVAQLFSIRNYSEISSLRDLDIKWSRIWRDQSPTNSLHPTKHLISKDSPKFYGLSMFPYPSGILHLGHLRVYTISDVVARYKRLKGYNVIHPMGWDAFGLPAENAAVEHGIDPIIWTETNIAKMKDQMNLMLADFDWDREISTCSPDYYKWTQEIFLLLYENGLAYRKAAEINWDPVDQTVLANEQVDAEGRSWRSGAKVEKKHLEQWFIGITKYAKELNADLKTLNQWPDKVKAMQRNWIGESHGAEIQFPSTNKEIPLVTVFTSRPDTLFSVQFLAISINHPLVEQYIATDCKLQEFLQSVKDAEPDSKEGYKLPEVKVTIPIDINNNKSQVFDIPVYVAPYVLGTYGHGAVMGCPGHDIRDYEFWIKHNPNQPVLQVVGVKDTINESTPIPYTDKSGILYDRSILTTNGISNLGQYHGKSVKEGGQLIIKNLEQTGLGKKSIQFRIRDWLISRQRYWGAPIPMIHCDSCGTVPVPHEQLPVLLPSTEGFEFGKGNPLAKSQDFLNTKCPSCGSNSAKRDTDTMDTFIDSSWYFFRYLDAQNTHEPFNKSIASTSMPVDMYVGGVEHAILHLLYTRFISKFLGDIGLWDGNQVRNEPIKRLVTQGMVQGKTFKDPDTGRFLKPEEVDLSNEPTIIATGKTPSVSYEKMSKSKYNGVDPQQCIEKYGADAVRAHMLFQAPVSDVLNWNEDQIAGVDRWLKKVLRLSRLIEEKLELQQTMGKSAAQEINLTDIEINGVRGSFAVSKAEFNLLKDVQSHVDDVDQAIDIHFSLNTVISDLMKMTNRITEAIQQEEVISQPILVDSYRKLLISMAPVAPATAEESWQLLLSQVLNQPWQSIFHEQFPIAQEFKSPFVSVKVIVDGKVRDVLDVEESFLEADEETLVRQLGKYIGDRVVKKVITKSGMVSIVTHR
ncbi:uncharacterized protein RJT21DRAFT_118916 [Scheffersomyces amazonensis]|uniref:uncharacterized protein n=1 Tax=Scheffersomyces amazonensis TaxID=1078765 RepID=UPI00315CF689